nr:hypothetical protein B0A51_04767 [Rachicladosporium sp. CCFEE 5018]
MGNMASAIAFMMADAGFRDDSGESLMDESDFENLGDQIPLGSLSSRFYWLGKRVFSNCLTDDIFNSCTPTDNGDDLDSAMVLKMAQYPFERRIQQLKLLGHLNSDKPIENGSNNEFFEFATRLAMAYSTGGEATKKRIVQVVRNGRLDGPSGHASTLHEPLKTEPSVNEGTASPAMDMPDSEAQIEDPNLPRYTSALKEYGDRRGVAYSWPTRQISTMPVTFRCTIQMDGRTCSGVARSKKEAKHLASQKACQHLRIEI